MPSIPIEDLQRLSDTIGVLNGIVGEVPQHVAWVEAAIAVKRLRIQWEELARRLGVVEVEVHRG